MEDGGDGHRDGNGWVYWIEMATIDDNVDVLPSPIAVKIWLKSEKVSCHILKKKGG